MVRRGYTLIEMVTALTVASVIVGIGVSALHMLLQAEQKGRDRVVQATAIARLAERFREDVAAATQVPSNPKPDEWRFTLPGDQSVTYRVLPDEVDWQQFAADRLVRRECFALPPHDSVALTVQDKTKPTEVSIVIKSRESGQHAARERRVVALLGKDHRFTSSSIGGK